MKLRPPNHGPVVVLGGYGAFGRQLVTMLAPSLAPIIVAGRDAAAARLFARSVRTRCPGARTSAARIDATAPDLAITLRGLRAGLVMHAAGPFQQQGYHVARACIAAGCHYIDLADGRGFVTGIGSLNESALSAGISIVSGASSVPGLSSVVVDHLAGDLASIDAIDIAIAPGNRMARGQATIDAILGYTGQPFFVWQRGQWRRVFGWQSLRRRRFPGIGPRWLAACDVPDVALLPGRYPGVTSVNFRAGLELKTLHFALWLMSGLTRIGLVNNWARYSGWIGTLARAFRRFGTDTGAMQVRVRGRVAAGQGVCRTWTLIARDGDGPLIPALPALIVARRILSGDPPAPGAQAALGLFRLEDFTAAVRGLNIEQHIEEQWDHGKTPHPARL